MGTLSQDLTGIKAIEDKLTANKVANFAYTNEAYNDPLTYADGVTEYDVDNEQNIPVGTYQIMKVNATILAKGWRSQASSITRMLMNHFLGRCSYNLNKVNDLMSSLLSTIMSHLGTANGLATLDANGRVPYTQLPESAMELKGEWNAQTNTPTLQDNVGDNGDFYYVSVGGTRFGQTFQEGDRICYFGTSGNGAWKRLRSGSVYSVNGNLPDSNGNVSITKSDVGLGNVSNVGSSATPSEGGTDNFTTGGAFTALANKVDKTTKVNGHALNGDVTVTKSDVGLGNVSNVGSSATPSEGGTDNFTTGGAFTALANKVDKTTKVNGHALSGDVTVTKSDVGLDKVANVGSSDAPVENGTDNFTTGGAYALKMSFASFPFRTPLELPRGLDPSLGVITADVWGFIEADLSQNTIGRLLALNAFIAVLKPAQLPVPSVPPTANFSYVFCPPTDDRYQYIRWAYANDNDLANKIFSGGGNTLVQLPQALNYWWGITDTFGKQDTDILVWFTNPTFRGENYIRAD